MKAYTKKNNKTEPSRIEMSEGDVSGLIEEIRSGKISVESQELLVKLLLGYVWISRQLEQKTLSLKKLLRLVFGAKTEKLKKSNKPQDKPDDKDADKDGSDGKNQSPPSSSGSDNENMGSDSGNVRPPPAGHGKNGHVKFEGAEHIAVPHAQLKRGDLCPECKTGRLYVFGQGSVLRFFGQPPIVAKVFEPEQLRCALCQVLFTAELPLSAGHERHHPSAKAMVAVLTSGSGVPAYRLEMLEKSLGVHLPDSTQSDLREQVANLISPVHKHLEYLAANGDLLHNDDTPNKILELMKENKSLPKDARKGMQTTGIVSLTGEGQKIALIATGRNHAGENLAALLMKRKPEAATPIQMGDAAKLNVTAEYRNLLIKCLCLDHGRRNFFEILENFPAECRHVVEELSHIYKHDNVAKRLGLTPDARLEHHQEHSGPVMNRLNTWMEEKLENREVEPNSALGKAIKYFVNHWNGLTQFLRIAGAPLSNAEVERLLKKCVLRRKNSMFYRTQVGAWIGDVLMSVIETARYAGKNPFEYLEVLQVHAARVRANPALWLPWNYQSTLAATLN
jgi:transposase